MNKLLTTSLVLLIFFTAFCGIQACISQTSPYVHPSSEKDTIWDPEGVLIWGRLPIRIYVEESLLYDVMSKDVASSIEVWNDAIGCEVLVPSSNRRSEIRVSLRPQPKKHPDWVASHTYRRGKGGPWYSDIKVYVVHLNNSFSRLNAMAHEIGHAFGLRDMKGDEDNIMYYKVSNYGLKIDPAAVEYLNYLYCQGKRD
jgi:hypothetical protein